MERLVSRIRCFLAGKDGAVTVDWVVLTAMIVGLAAPIGINYIGSLTRATQVVASNIAAQDYLISSP
jgi:hypothetical protein